MKRILAISYLLIFGIFFACSCKQDSSVEKSEDDVGVIYFRNYSINGEIPEQFLEGFPSEQLQYRIDSFEYKFSKPLKEGRNYCNDVITDSILHLWNQISMENIIKTDPNLRIDGNHTKYQKLKIGEYYRTEFCRTINCFYPHLYDIGKGFYVVETENHSVDPILYAIHLILPQGNNKLKSYQFRFRIWYNSEFMAYLKSIEEIDYDDFNYYLTELKKQNKYDILLWGPSELTVSYFHKDTIESYVSVEYGNFDIIPKMGNLLNGDK